MIIPKHKKIISQTIILLSEKGLTRNEKIEKLEKYIKENMPLNEKELAKTFMTLAERAYIESDEQDK